MTHPPQHKQDTVMMMTKMTNSNKYFIKGYMKSLSFCLPYLTHNISDDDDIHDDDKGDKQQQVFYQRLHKVIVFLSSIPNT